jgi:hypothetical protein
MKEPLKKIVIWISPNDMGVLWNAHLDGWVKKFLVPEDPVEQETDPREFAREVQKPEKRKREGNGHSSRHRGEVPSINVVLSIMQREPDKIWHTEEIGEELHSEWDFASSTASSCLQDLKKHLLVVNTGMSQYQLTDAGKKCPQDADLKRNVGLR